MKHERIIETRHYISTDLQRLNDTLIIELFLTKFENNIRRIPNE